MWAIDALSHRPVYYPVVPGYDAIPRLVGTKYDVLLNASMFDTSPQETNARMAKFDRDQADQHILAQSGWAGTIDSLVAVAANPLWLVLIVVWVSLRAKRASWMARNRKV